MRVSERNALFHRGAAGARRNGRLPDVSDVRRIVNHFVILLRAAAGGGLSGTKL
jgi:hypothetical protein